MINSSDSPDIRKACIQTLDGVLLKQNKIGIDVLRLDKIHPVISGNKWFKLKYYLADVSRLGKKGIITFGGAYSNHLVATAYACKLAGLLSIGIIRGEKPVVSSPTLVDLELYCMELQFYSRNAYKDQDVITRLRESYPDYLIVDEGGRGQAGIKGAEDILKLQSYHSYSHILCAVGTGTMITGILNAALPVQKIIGVPVLKMNTGNNGIVEYIYSNSSSKNFILRNDYHFGGYAKKNERLVQFMNHLYHSHNIPTDFVYTGKLFYGTFNMIENGYFDPGSKLLIIHSGGLQGNRSLPAGTLDFSY